MEEYSEFLTELIAINHERVEGYTNAIAGLTNSEDEDLRQVLVQYRSQTQHFIQQLTTFAGDAEAPTAKTPSQQGKLLQLWKSNLPAIAGTDRRSILESCEQREDIYRQVYEEAIIQLDDVPLAIANTIRQQAELQYMTHNHIKTLRDAI